MLVLAIAVNRTRDNKAQKECKKPSAFTSPSWVLTRARSFIPIPMKTGNRAIDGAGWETGKQHQQGRGRAPPQWRAGADQPPTRVGGRGSSNVAKGERPEARGRRGGGACGYLYLLTGWGLGSRLAQGKNPRGREQLRMAAAAVTAGDPVGRQRRRPRSAATRDPPQHRTVP